LGQRPIIHVCIVSADLFRSVLDVRVESDAELLMDHHLLVTCIFEH